MNPISVGTAGLNRPNLFVLGNPGIRIKVRIKNSTENFQKKLHLKHIANPQRRDHNSIQKWHKAP